MALTRIAPAGIGTTPEGSGFNIGSSNLHGLGLDATNAKFTGIVTSQNIRVLGDLQVDGTTTTLDTVVTSVDKLEVEANNTTVAVAITQSGSGDGMIVLGGNLGVGTASPSQPLHVEGNARITGILSVGQGTITLDSSQNMIKLGALTMHRDGSSGDAILMNTGGTYNPFRASKFLIDAVEVIGNDRVGKFAKVGIGTTNPIGELMIENATQSHITVKTSGSNMAKFGSKGNDVYIGGTAGAANIIFKRNITSIDHPADSGTETLRITSAGNVGIGEDSPDVRLHVKEQFDTAYSLTSVTTDTNHLLKLENPSSTANAFAGMQFRVGGGADLYFGAIQQSVNHGDFFFANQNSPQKEMMRIKSTGNVGIGENDPETLLHLKAATAPILTIQNTSNTSYTGIQFDTAADNTQFAIYSYDASHGSNADNVQLYNYRAGDISLHTNSTERLRIDSDGRLLLGLNASAGGHAFFQVHGSGNKKAQFHQPDSGNCHIQFTNTQTGTSYNNGVQIGLGDDEQAQIWNYYNSYFRIATNNTERLRITAAGDMGLGTATPTSFGPTFQIAGTDPALLLQDTATAVDYYGMNIGNGHVTSWFDDSAYFAIGTASGISGASYTERVRINSAGNMGVGNVSPTQARLVAQTASGMSIAAVKDNTGASISLGGVTQPRILMEAGASASEFKLYTAGGSSYGSASWTERLRIASDGSVGIQQTNPNNVLDIGGVGTNGLSVRMGGSGYSTLFRYGSNEDNYITQGASGSTYFRSRENSTHAQITSAGDIILYKDEVEFAGNGYVTTKGSGDFVIRTTSGYTNRLRVLNDGRTIIGNKSTTEANRILTVYDPSNSILKISNDGSSSSSYSQLEFDNGSGSSSAWLWRNSAGNTSYGGEHSLNFYQTEAASFAFFTGGNNKRLEIDGNGRITTPSNVAFVAYRNQSTWTVNQNTTFVFNQTRFQRGGTNFNTSNGYFTAPVAGVYHFHAYSITSGSITNGWISLRHNNARIMGGDVHFTQTFNNWHFVSVTAIINMAANDTVNLYNGGLGYTFHGNQWSGLSGYLVG